MSTRTDPGFPITNGTFILGYNSEVSARLFPRGVPLRGTGCFTALSIDALLLCRVPFIVQGITDFDPEHRSRTQPIPFNATADVVRLALEALPGVGPVEVRRYGPSALNEFEWKVTWDWGKDPVDIRGDLNNLIPDALYLGGRWTGKLTLFWCLLLPDVPCHCFATDSSSGEPLRSPCVGPPPVCSSRTSPAIFFSCCPHAQGVVAVESLCGSCARVSGPPCVGAPSRRTLSPLMPDSPSPWTRLRTPATPCPASGPSRCTNSGCGPETATALARGPLPRNASGHQR